jgi:hypothetical protein
MKSVYCAVRTGSLNKAVCASSLKGYFSPDLQFALPAVAETLSGHYCVLLSGHVGCLNMNYIIL